MAPNKEYMKEYYLINQDKLIEYSRQYKEINKDKIVVVNKNYKLINKEYIQEMNLCSCGGRYTNCHRSKHMKTKKHQLYKELIERT